MAFFLWGVLALGLAGVLVFSSQVEFLVPALAAVIVFLLAMVPGLEQAYWLQTLVWLGLTGTGLLVFGRRLRQWRTVSKRVEDPIAGRIAVVVEALDENGVGRVKFQGTTWKAVSTGPVPVGTSVVVLGQSGLELQVEQPEPSPEDKWKALGAGQKTEEG